MFLVNATGVDRNQSANTVDSRIHRFTWKAANTGTRRGCGGGKGRRWGRGGRFWEGGRSPLQVGEEEGDPVAVVLVVVVVVERWVAERMQEQSLACLGCSGKTTRTCRQIHRTRRSCHTRDTMSTNCDLVFSIQPQLHRAWKLSLSCFVRSRFTQETRAIACGSALGGSLGCLSRHGDWLHAGSQISTRSGTLCTDSYGRWLPCLTDRS